ncbi:hypothetical protein HJFPF1_08424 [Paramyrothecium foliicola]|nr:hypothetical protein HJFPF1_08424 [Paramyrothecium foliicola]
MVAATASASSITIKDGKPNSKLYAYEVPPLKSGEYVIVSKQAIKAPNGEHQDIVSTQPMTIRTCEPYVLPRDLVHSFYPPNMATVSATTLPHIVLKGATPWERSPKNASGSTPAAPTPWLALLLFTDEELCAPPDFASTSLRTLGTKAVTLPLSIFNAKRSSYCHTADLTTEDVLAKPDGSEATADFIFLKGASFKMYFEQQDGAGKSVPQTRLDLNRYTNLSFMTDAGVDDGTGHGSARFSTLLGHRMRPYTSAKGNQKVHAHVVSLERAAETIDWGTAKLDSTTVALLSVFSWTFTWGENNADASKEIFKQLSGTIRPLVVPLQDLPPKVDRDDPSVVWVRERVQQGYTIVRHRDMAGQSAMALYRGPLMPKLSRRVHLRPSTHGSDLQIIDSQARIIDISYAVAWELGRSLAGRDAKYSASIAALRRRLCMKAVTKSMTAGQHSGARGPEIQVIHKAKDVVNSVVDRLDRLFDGSVASKIHGLPENGTPQQKAARWTVPSHNSSSMLPSPGVMTQAKLKRNLQTEAREWLEGQTKILCEGDPSAPVSPELALIFEWLVGNLMSLKLVPANYLFPDPSALGKESINCFIMDDVWIDAMVDGAMSLANTMGGGDDPIRDEIRGAFNMYLQKAPARLVQIGGSGFVIRSGIVESFPDLEVNVTTKATGSTPAKPLGCAYRARNDDMLLCLVARGEEQALVDYTVKLKLPPHQQQFAVTGIQEKKMDFACELKPFLKADKAGGSENDLHKQVTWTVVGDTIQSSPPSFPTIWNWNTGVLVPHLIAKMMDDFIDADKARQWNKPAADSKSLYLATQLVDRDHSITLDCNVSVPGEKSGRVLFPEPRQEDDNTREMAVLHAPQSSIIQEKGRENSGTRQSWFTKTAFSQDAPGRSIPAQSDSPQHLVFSIKMTSARAPPTDVEITCIELYIPLGEDPTDLLDHLAPVPTVRCTSPRQKWVAAVMHKKTKTDSELVVHLRPRGGKGAALVAGMNASFVLSRATVNGVMGDVEIRVKEMYRKRMGKTVGGKETFEQLDVEDSWMLLKE